MPLWIFSTIKKMSRTTFQFLKIIRNSIKHYFMEIGNKGSFEACAGLTIHIYYGASKWDSHIFPEGLRKYFPL